MRRPTLAETLIAYRDSQSLTQKEMAQKLGVSRQSYNYYEHGVIPRPAMMRKISELLGWKIEVVAQLKEK